MARLSLGTTLVVRCWFVEPDGTPDGHPVDVPAGPTVTVAATRTAGSAAPSTSIVLVAHSTTWPPEVAVP